MNRILFVLANLTLFPYCLCRAVIVLLLLILQFEINLNGSLSLIKFTKILIATTIITNSFCR